MAENIRLLSTVLYKADKPFPDSAENPNAVVVLKSACRLFFITTTKKKSLKHAIFSPSVKSGKGGFSLTISKKRAANIP